MRPVAHGLRAVTGRDPEESGRSATTLELLYDLTFVVAIGVAAAQFAHMLASGDMLLASGGFAFAMFAICLTWINFTWYGSAFDTDDWFHRILTLTQLVGVAVLAVGIGPMFASLHDGGHSVAGTGEVHGHVDMIAIVVGYVIMRLGYVLLRVRVAWHAPEHRPVAVRYIVLVVLAQVLWVVAVLAPTDLVWSFVCIGVLGLFEVSIPALAQGRADGTPWHPHHIAERYGLLTIIALGEIVVGTVDSASAIVDAHEGHWNVPPPRSSWSVSRSCSGCGGRTSPCPSATSSTRGPRAASSSGTGWCRCSSRPRPPGPGSTSSGCTSSIIRNCRPR